MQFEVEGEDDLKRMKIGFKSDHDREVVEIYLSHQVNTTEFADHFRAVLTYESAMELARLIQNHARDLRPSGDVED